MSASELLGLPFQRRGTVHEPWLTMHVNYTICHVWWIPVGPTDPCPNAAAHDISKQGLSCGTRTRSLFVLLCWPLSVRPRQHEKFALIGLCWLYGRSEFPPPPPQARWLWTRWACPAAAFPRTIAHGLNNCQPSLMTVEGPSPPPKILS